MTLPTPSAQVARCARLAIGALIAAAVMLRCWPEDRAGDGFALWLTAGGALAGAVAAMWWEPAHRGPARGEYAWLALASAVSAGGVYAMWAAYAQIEAGGSLPVQVSQLLPGEMLGMSAIGALLITIDRQPGRRAGLLVAINIGLILVPHYHFGHGCGSRSSACHANQRTVDDALAALRADHPHAPPFQKLDLRLWCTLKSGGYLQSIPQDAGQGPHSTCHYYLTPLGVACTVHGCRSDPVH